MRLWRWGAGAMLGAATLLVAGCGLLSESYRYRMTIEVMTPEGIRTGSSVIEVTTGKGPAFPGPEAATLHTRINGEAVAVDLPSGQTLFALLRNPTLSNEAAASYASSAYAEREPGLRQMNWRERIKALKQMRGQAELPRSAYHMFVRFGDTANPGTVEQVDANDLAAVFGSGVRLQRVTITVTDDAVTKGIEQRLPWLNSLAKFRRDPGNPFTSTLPSEIGGLQLR